MWSSVLHQKDYKSVATPNNCHMHGSLHMMDYCVLGGEIWNLTLHRISMEDKFSPMLMWPSLCGARPLKRFFNLGDNLTGYTI